VLGRLDTGEPMWPGCIHNVLWLQPRPGKRSRTGWRHCQALSLFQVLPLETRSGTLPLLLYLLCPAQRVGCIRL